MCTSGLTRSSRSTRSASSSGSMTVKATTKGHRPGVGVGPRTFPGEVVWAIEDCRHLSARLERDLLTAGQQVVRVPPKMMAEVRASARTRGKSDPIDALAVARAFLREPDLPVASHDEVSRELKLLVDRRETWSDTGPRRSTVCCGGCTSSTPSMPPKPRSLDLAKHQQALRSPGCWAWTGSSRSWPGRTRRRDRPDRADQGVEQADHRAGREGAPALLAMPGCGALTAAKLVGEIGRDHPVRRRGQVRPPRRRRADPGVVGQHRGPGPDDQIREPATQRRAAPDRGHPDPHDDGLGRSYYDKENAEGKSTTEALRCLKRRLARIVFNTLQTQPVDRRQPTSRRGLT